MSGLPDGDAALAALGITRLAVPIPFVDAGGPVNVYALEQADGGLTLFDAGLGTSEAEASLRASAFDARLDLKRVQRIVVSHGHIDHYGLAETFAEESGATVHVHPADWRKVVGERRLPGLLPEFRRLFAALGVPGELVEKMVASSLGLDRYARRVSPERARSLLPGERLRFAKFEVEVLHLPGHTPGLVCLWDADHRILFADDHLLARVSPNPLIELELQPDGRRFEPLRAYLASTRRVYDLEVDWVLPGHGAPFQGHRALLESLWGFYETRQGKILDRLREGEATAFELVPTVFRKLDEGRLYLTLSEILANLEVMEADGRVVRVEREGITRFRARS